MPHASCFEMHAYSRRTLCSHHHIGLHYWFSKTSRIPSNTTGDAWAKVGSPLRPRKTASPGDTGLLPPGAPRDTDLSGRGSSIPSPISSTPEAVRSASSAMSSLEECLRRGRGSFLSRVGVRSMGDGGDSRRGDGERCMEHVDEGGEGCCDGLEDKNSVSRSWRRSVTVMPGGRLKSGRGMRL
jgi:hypothetical protein